ncbi:MAG: KH domain-containing protein, partial [Caldilineales bacterium]|nr:KH domain-containing protein [Caldilineales bacterium]
PSGGPSMSAMKDLVEYIAKALADKPQQVQVSEIEGEAALVLELRVAPEDMGRIIGKDGRTANAIRTLVRVLAAKQGKRVTLEIV